MSSEEQRQKEEAASRRHAKLDNAGVLHMSTQAEIPDKITIVSTLLPYQRQVSLQYLILSTGQSNHAI